MMVFVHADPKERNKDASILIDRNFSPAPRAYGYKEPVSYTHLFFKASTIAPIPLSIQETIAL